MKLDVVADCWLSWQTYDTYFCTDKCLLPHPSQDGKLKTITGFHWAIRENIHNIPRTDFRNSKAKGWGLWTGIPKTWRDWRYGISTGDRQKCIPWKSLFYGLNHVANKAQTDEAADNGGSRIQHRLTSVLQSDQSGMCSCSFAKEKPTKRGLYSFIDYFVHSIWNMVFFFTILIFEACGIKSNCWPQRLKYTQSSLL